MICLDTRNLHSPNFWPCLCRFQPRKYWYCKLFFYKSFPTLFFTNFQLHFAHFQPNLPFHFFAQVHLFCCCFFLACWCGLYLSLIQEITLYFWLCLAAYFWPIFSLLFSLLEPFAARKKVKRNQLFCLLFGPISSITFDLNTIIIFACLAPFALTD